MRGAVDRIAADADAGALAVAALGELPDGFVGERAGAGDDADVAALVDVARRDADAAAAVAVLAAAGSDEPGTVRPDEAGFEPASMAFTRIMSLTGMPSVMQTTSSTPASTASRIASAAKAGGTKMAEAVAPVSRTASPTVSKIGTTLFKDLAAFPGVTPATTWVP